MPQSDVVIVGGGLSGLTLALQLRRALPDLSVTVLERRRYPVPETTFKVGESMVEISSWYLREVLGLGDHLRSAHLPKLGLRFFMSDAENRDIGRRPEYGVLNLPRGEAPVAVGPDDEHGSRGFFPGLHLPTYNVDRGRLENHLLTRCREAGAGIVEACIVKDVRLGSPHVLITNKHAGLRARWMIDASGRVGFLARRLNIRQAEKHEVNAVWFRLDGRIDPDRWTADASYHARMPPNLRWLSTNHLMGPGYWIWLIPLPTGATSVGIMADPARYSFEQFQVFDRALTWLRAREPQLAEVASTLDVLDFHAMKVRAYLSRRTFSTERWALCGESAFFVEALYSPGGDFIAVGNNLIVQMIMADRSGERLRLSILANFGEQLFGGMFRHYTGLYRGSYGLMGRPGLMLQKVAWDTAAYFGYNVYLFCNDRLCDFDFHRTIREENLRFERLQRRMIFHFRHHFQRSDAASESYTGRFVDQGCIEPVQSLYDSSKYRRADPEDVRLHLRANMDVLENFSTGVVDLVT